MPRQVNIPMLRHPTTVSYAVCGGPDCIQSVFWKDTNGVRGPIYSMDGIHDMGGMHGFGPVLPEENEPVFHAAWEGRIFGIAQALGPHGIHNPHGMRSAQENLEPATYLGSGYYERWLEVTERALLAKGLLNREELDARAAFFRDQTEAVAPRREDTDLRQRMLRAVYSHRSPIRDSETTPRFKAGDAVIVRNLHPKGHTRLPGYVRGRRGVVARFYGIHDFHDALPAGQSADPQPMYNVRFDGGELWGGSAEPNQSLHLDMWESYLEPA